MKHRRPARMAMALALWMLLIQFASTGCGSPPAEAVAEAAPAPSGELAVDRQSYIWDAEHITFKIETYVGKPLIKALVKRDAAALAGFLRPEFRARVPGPDAPAEVYRVGVIAERRVAGATTDVAADGFVGHLLGMTEPFGTARSGGLRVIAIDRVGDDPGHWNVRLLITVGGVGKDGGPMELEAEGSGTIRFAEDADFDTGRVVAAVEIEAEALRSSPAPLMEEGTAAAGLADLGLLDNWELPPEGYRVRRYQPAVADYDGDGWLDILLGGIDGRPRLLRSISGRRFEDVVAASGLLPSEAHPDRWAINGLACFIDYDNDARPDVLLAERLYHNEGGRFLDVSAASGLRFDRVPLGCVVLDYDLDGLLDLYVVYQKGFRQRNTSAPKPWVDDPEAGAENMLWRNEGGGRFRDVTAEANAGAGNHQTFAAVALYWDDDRFPDLYSANDFGRNVLLRNRGDGTFEDVTDATGAGDFATSMGVAAGDIDNDGFPEIYVANMFSKMGRRIIAHVNESDYPPGIYEQIVGSCAGNRLYRRGSEGPAVTEISVPAGVNEVGWAYAPAMVDLDGDGRLDLYSTTGYMSFKRDEPDG